MMFIVSVRSGIHIYESLVIDTSENSKPIHVFPTPIYCPPELDDKTVLLKTT